MGWASCWLAPALADLPAGWRRRQAAARLGGRRRRGGAGIHRRSGQCAHNWLTRTEHELSAGGMVGQICAVKREIDKQNFRSYRFAEIGDSKPGELRLLRQARTCSLGSESDSEGSCRQREKHPARIACMHIADGCTATAANGHRAIGCRCLSVTACCEIGCPEGMGPDRSTYQAE